VVNEDIEELPMDPSQGHEYLAGGGTWTQANLRGHLAGEGISELDEEPGPGASFTPASRTLTEAIASMTTP
jgi:hypothetical protein